jgi:phosphate transport system protein
MTTRTTLRRDLADLKQKIYLLGEKCIEISELHTSLLENHNTNLENSLIQISNDVKKESKELNDQCFLVLTLQQPLIKDLRFVIGSLQVVLNLEKISEQYISTLPQIVEVNVLKVELKEQLLKMSEKVLELLRNSLTLYLSTNIDQVQSIDKTLSEIGFLHDILYKQILNELAVDSGQKAKIEAQLLATVRSLEKISDSVQNIIEQVKYIIHGKAETQST